MEFRALFLLAWALIIAQLARSALFTTDVIVLGWLGAQFVAAGALANALFGGTRAGVRRLTGRTGNSARFRA